jgi:excisionase family DNA binding protein
MVTGKKQVREEANVTPSIMVGIPEAARLLGISRTTLLALDANGKLGPRPHRLGRRVLWERAELEEWAKAGCPSRRTWSETRARARVKS